MIRPSLLHPHDKVLVVAPAGAVDASRVEHALELLSSWGLEAESTTTVGNRFFRYSGRDSDRLNDLHRALSDASVKAVFCARGGYGSVRLLSGLELFPWRSVAPKWLIGFSDITVLHAFFNRVQGWQTIHGPMPGGYIPGNAAHGESWERLRELLFRGPSSTRVPAHPMNRCGRAAGVLTGGNISVLYGLNGTPYLPVREGDILFLEEIGESLYHLDRMMMNLRLSGILSMIGGLIVGGMTAMKDDDIPFGKSAEEIVREHASGYDYPVVFGFPAGHDALNLPLLLGAEVVLDVCPEGVGLSFLSN